MLVGERGTADTRRNSDSATAGAHSSPRSSRTHADRREVLGEVVLGVVLGYLVHVLVPSAAPLLVLGAPGHETERARAAAREAAEDLDEQQRDLVILATEGVVVATCVGETPRSPGPWRGRTPHQACRACGSPARCDAGALLRCRSRGCGPLLGSRCPGRSLGQCVSSAAGPGPAKTSGPLRAILGLSTVDAGLPLVPPLHLLDGASRPTS